MRYLFLPSFILFLVLISSNANSYDDSDSASVENPGSQTEHCVDCDVGRSPGFSNPILIPTDILSKVQADEDEQRSKEEIREAAKRMIKSCYITRDELSPNAKIELQRNNPGKDQNQIASEYSARKKTILNECLLPVIPDENMRIKLVEEFVNYRVPSSKTSSIDEMVDAVFKKFAEAH